MIGNPIPRDSLRPARGTREEVVLVDEDDRPVGPCEKLAAHREGLLHRAFSVFVINGRDELLLQRRAASKYHSGGLWSNTCCGHPRPEEDTESAAHRRLREEMGIDCLLRPAFTFRYRVELDGGLVENEVDHVFVGRHEGDPRPDAREADGWCWTPLEEVARDLERRPETYTAWFRIALPRFMEGLPPPVQGADRP